MADSDREEGETADPEGSAVYCKAREKRENLPVKTGFKSLYRLLLQRRKDQLLVLQNFAERSLVFLNNALIRQNCFLILRDGELVGKNRFLVFHNR